MKILIFEDEKLTAERLVQLLKRYDSQVEVLDIIPSVKEGVTWLENNPAPDLVMMDIQLSDGNCFELFGKSHVQFPVIFTTAYNEYAIRAFKVNSIDYLVKPIDYKELHAAMEKFKRLEPAATETPMPGYRELLKTLTDPYKERFMVKVGEQYKFIETRDIAYFFYDEGLVFARTYANKDVPMNLSLDKIEKSLDPHFFYRINRKFLISAGAIVEMHAYSNSRVKIQLKPTCTGKVIVSRERVGGFKEWLGG